MTWWDIFTGPDGLIQVVEDTDEIRKVIYTENLVKKPGDVVVYTENPNLAREQRNRNKVQAIFVGAKAATIAFGKPDDKGPIVVKWVDPPPDHQHDWEPWDAGRVHCKDPSCGLVGTAATKDNPDQNRPVNEHPTHHRSCLIRYGGGCSCG